MSITSRCSVPAYTIDHELWFESSKGLCGRADFQGICLQGGDEVLEPCQRGYEVVVGESKEFPARLGAAAMARSRWAGVCYGPTLMQTSRPTARDQARAGSLPLSTTMTSKEPEGIVWAAASWPFGATCRRLRVGMMTLAVELSITWFHAAGLCRR